MAEIGQEIVKRYLEELGFEVRKIPESDVKTPDYEVFLNEQLVFYCEEKTLEYDDFEGVKDDPTYNSISAHVHKATKQFNSINPNREYPNVLAFVNFDTLKNVHDLFTTLTGHILLESGEYMKIHRVGRITSDLDQIDLYLWFDKEKFINKIWGEVHSIHDENLKKIIPNKDKASE
ncbi:MULTISPECIES: hypothetical protein [Paenibacillus]|uniref:Uncharacterized protein n=2 Tax=Paenibacillus TaxID=44249 RepID=A0A9X2BT08_9BACL|nr:MULTISPECIES: hypothetical protein [Paenibacillus]MCK8487401.1 hypothetical protein [Paenibacillus mellifer]SMF49017.1 hypothetical protein SAMN02744124_03348 [Paenibacillus barengoltzii J12]